MSGSAGLAALLDRFRAAAEAGNGEAFAACFTGEGVYHDCFYGAFRGREEIARMLGIFHRDGEDFRWDFIAPMEEGGRGYARYLFSYRSKLPEAEGKRSIFEGVACLTLENGLIADYEEVANAAVGLARIGFPDARLGKFLRKEAEALAARPEANRHL